MRAEAGRLPFCSNIAVFFSSVHALIFTESNPAESFLGLASHDQRSSPSSFCLAPGDPHAVLGPVPSELSLSVMAGLCMGQCDRGSRGVRVHRVRRHTRLHAARRRSRHILIHMLSMRLGFGRLPSCATW